MELSSYLYFAGNCEEAFRFYAKVTGGTIGPMMRYREAPQEAWMEPAMGEQVLHMTMTLNGHDLMGADMPAARFTSPGGFAMTLAVAGMEEGRRVFGALAEGGQVQMALAPTFWSPGFGMCRDRFGVPWMVNVAE